ncbi:TPA: HNH endonuclease signature motif containing protein [Stenotrophomonas maltophilia]
MSGPKRYRTPELAFDARIRKAPNGCWEWTGFIDRKGYGVLGIGHRKVCKVHRYAYQRFVGPVPDGMQLDHLCRNRCCANPEHLEPVTPQVNVVRGNQARGLAAACQRGHEFSKGNTYINPRGNRECRQCRRSAALRHKEKALGTRN